MTNPVYDALASEAAEGTTDSESEIYSDPRKDDDGTQDEDLDVPDPS